MLSSDPGGRGSRLSVTMADGSIGYFTTEVFQCQKKVACECGGVCVCVCVCVCACWMLLSNQNFEHKVEWVEVVMGVTVGC